jgi:hypothetical protein
MNAPRGIQTTEFKPSAYTNYAEEMQKIADHLSNAIARAKKVREIDVELWRKLLTTDIRNLAQCCVLSDEFAAARQYYHVIVRIEMLLSKIVHSNRFPKLEKKGKLPAFHTGFSDGYTEAILANDDVLLLEFSRSLDPREQPQSDHRFSWYVTNAIRLHVLGDQSSARQQILQAHKLEYFRLASKGYSHAVLGIIERDIYLVNEGIDLRIRHHKTKEFKSIYFEYCEEATALARLAIRAGLRPNIQSPFISRKLLTDRERATDDIVDRLVSAFEYANNRKGNVLWVLNRMFGGELFRSKVR